MASGPGDVLDRDLDKTLELVWLLILHYHIDCRSQQHSSQSARQRKNTCKQSMLVWVNAVLPGRNITNFSTDWSSGENLVSLINYCQPGLIGLPGKGDHLYNQLALAMHAAQDTLNVPQILSPDDMFVDQPDEVSIMTYLSYFCRIGSPGERALLAWFQQQIPSQHVTNLTSDWVSGINLGALINKLTRGGFPQYKRFSSSTPFPNTEESMRKAEELLKIPPSVSAESLSSDDLAYLVKLAYLVQFYASHKGEPVVMKIDIGKVEVSPVNRGLEGGNKIVWIDVDCSNAGTAELTASVTTKAGKKIDVSVTDIHDREEQYRVKFLVEEGVEVYIVSIQYAGQEVNGSPFHVNLADADATKVQHLGTDAPTEFPTEGQESQPVLLGFDTKDAGYGKLTATASGESAGSVPAQLVPKPRGGFDVVFTPPIPDVYLVDVQWGKFMALAKGYSCGTVPIEFQQDSRKDFKLAFEPPSPDVYTVDVMWGGKPVPGSPFTINLLPPAQPEKVEIGDPLFGGVGENVDLPVDLTHAGSGVLTATCTGDKVGKVEMKIIPISKKLHQVTFLAIQIDVYHLSVFFNDVHIPGSPFRIDLSQKRVDSIIPQLQKRPKVKVYAINLVSGGKSRASIDPIPDVIKCYIGQALLLKVTPSSEQRIIAKAAKAAKALLFKDGDVRATATGDKTGHANIKVEKTIGGAYEVIFKPKKTDHYTITVHCQDQPVFQQPLVAVFEKPVNNPKMVVISGVKGQNFYAGQEFSFDVKTGAAGIGPLKALVQGPGEETTRQVKVYEEGRDKYIVRYLPSNPGVYLIHLLWGDAPIPGTPVKIEVKDLPSVPHGEPVLYKIPVGKWKLSDIESIGTHLDTGRSYQVERKQKRGKFIFGLQPDEPGTYEIALHVDGKDICQPYRFRYDERPSRPEKVFVLHPKTNGVVSEILEFIIDVSKAGVGPLKIQTKGPRKARTNNTGFRDGVYTITFSALSPGKYWLTITWGGEEITGSPFCITITSNIDSLDNQSVLSHDDDSGIDLPDHNERHRSPSSGTEDTLIHSGDTGTDEGKETSPKPIDEKAIQVITHDLEMLLSEEETISKPLSWVIDASEIKGRLEVTAVGEKSGPADVLITQTQERLYRITFQPTVSDKYTISVLLNGKHVPKSPRIINYKVPATDVNKVRIEGWGDIPPLITVGHTIHFFVDTQEAGVGELKVNPKPPKSKAETHTVEVEEQDENPSIYRVSYTPLIIGVHSLELLFSQLPLPGTPLQVSVCDPQAVIFTHTTQKVVSIGQLLKMEVDTSKAGSHQLTATCHGTRSGEISVSISQTKTKGKYEISFKHTGDIYTLVVKLGGYQIKGSPFKLNLTSIEIEKVIVTGPLQPEGPGGPIQLAVDTTGLPQGKMESHCTLKKKSVSVQVQEVSLKHYELSFVPKEPGIYLWSVEFHGQHVPGSPFRIDTRPNADRAVVTVPDLSGTHIGQYVSYEVDTSEAGMGTLTAICRGQINKNIPVEITQVRHSVYRVSFLPLSFDKYTLHIQWSGQQVPNSPFVFDLRPPNSQDISKRQMEIPFILPRIEDTSAVRVMCTGEKYGVIPVSLVPVSANNYRISFRPQGPDLYTISLLYNGVHIKGSPFHLDLRVPEDEEEKTRQDGDVVVTPGKPGAPTPSEYNMIVGMAFILKMLVKGTQAKIDGTINASAVGTKVGNTPIHVDSHSKTVTFNPKAADTYKLDVKVDGEPVAHSPFTVHYSDPPSDPSRVSIVGLEDILSALDIDKEVSLVINAMRGGSGTLKAEVSGPKPTIVDVRARDGEPGTYNVSFLPTAPGLYILSLFWNDQHIPNSPLKIRVVDTSNAIRVQPGKKANTGDLKIESAPTDIRAYAVKRGNTKKLKVTVKQVKTHLYRFIFSYKQPGYYFIHITVSGEEIDQSPIPVYISQPPRPKNCHVHNRPTVGYINENISMIIDCKEGGEGTLEARVLQPNKVETKLTVVDNKDGTFTIAYVPTAEGIYTFYALWSGHPIAGSPYHVVVRKPTQNELPISKVSVVDLLGRAQPFSGGNQLNIPMNSHFVFNVQLNKKQARSFSAKAVGEGGQQLDFITLESSGNLFTYSFQGPTPGKYTLNFSLGDINLNLPQLPSILNFYIAEVDARKVKLLLHTISGLLLIDRKIFFQVDTRLAGNGKLQAKLQGPSHDIPDVRIVPTPDMPHYYDIFFTPIVAGSYRLELLWDKTIIPGFPLIFNVIEPSIRHGESSSFEIPIDSHAKDISSYAMHVETGEQYKVQIHQVSKRRYRFEFHPKVSGKYNLHVLVGGRDIEGSPFPLFYEFPPQAGSVVVSKFPQRAPVGSDVKFFINAQAAGSGHLNVRTTGPEKVLINLTELLPGSYRAEFTTPTVPGIYSVHITWSGEEIPESPLVLDVIDKQPDNIDFPLIPEPDIDIDTPLHTLPHDHITPSIIESDLAIFGKRHTLGKISFSIIHNGYPDSLDIQFSGSTDLPFNIIKGPRANRYEIDPRAPGDYEMTIFWNGSTVSGATYTLSFDLPKGIGGLDLRDQVFQVGRPYEFAINTGEISQGALEITCEPRDAADIVLTAVTETQYQCSLVPMKTGEVEIAVWYDGFQIQGSPFLVHFQATSAFNCKFKLQSEGVEISNISALLDSTDTDQSIPVSLQQLFGGECSLNFVPTDGDEYRLTITCDLKIKRKALAGSPFTLVYVPVEMGALMCHIEGDIPGAVVGEWSKFLVNCEGGGSGELTARISGSGGAEVKVVSLSKFMYEVHYRISVAGKYRIRVLWDGRDIMGSPLNFTIKSTSLSQSQMSVRVSKVPVKVTLPQPIEFEFQVKGAERKSELTVEATTPSGSKQTGSLSAIDEGYRVSIPTNQPGDHSIAILYMGKELLQPFTVKVLGKGEHTYTIVYDTVDAFTA